ncbi:hypothetical protein PS691_04540 [Pseudomonas fluorescens]|uniref:Uncharacterized protein n=1 Tax=Pseudomonas fluorescens TaxID=294 RepID=A0A5E7EG51_PSEFL|nr:hypothetical protein PS691_04540 [Pseudomonas fluorescens]
MSNDFKPQSRPATTSQPLEDLGNPNDDGCVPGTAGQRLVWVSMPGTEPGFLTASSPATKEGFQLFRIRILLQRLHLRQSI